MCGKPDCRIWAGMLSLNWGTQSRHLWHLMPGTWTTFCSYPVHGMLLSCRISISFPTLCSMFTTGNNDFCFANYSMKSTNLWRLTRPNTVRASLTMLLLTAIYWAPSWGTQTEKSVNVCEFWQQFKEKTAGKLYVEMCVGQMMLQGLVLSVMSCMRTCA